MPSNTIDESRRHVAGVLEELLTDLDGGAFMQCWRKLSLMDAGNEFWASNREAWEKAALFYNEIARDMKGFCLHSLLQGELRLADPLSGNMLVTSRSVFCGRWSFYPVIDGHEICLIATVGSWPKLIYYPQRRLVVALPGADNNPEAALADFARVARRNWPQLLDYLCCAASPSRVACMIGEERPTHFFREMIPALLWLRDTGQLSRLLSKIEYFLEVRDWTFAPMEDLLPDLLASHSYAKLSADFDAVPEIAFRQNLFIFGFLRSGDYVSDAYLEDIRRMALGRTLPSELSPPRQGAGNSAAGACISFSVDSEKGRFRNQRAIFKCYLNELRVLLGTDFTLVVDGWTPPRTRFDQQAVPITRDQRIIARVEQFVESVFAQLGWRPDRVIPAYKACYIDKIALYSKVQFFVSTHGTAILPPSLIWRCSGVSYHNPDSIDIDSEAYLPALRKVPKAGLSYSDERGRPLAAGTRQFSAPSRAHFMVSETHFLEVLRPYLRQTLVAAGIAACVPDRGGDGQRQAIGQG